MGNTVRAVSGFTTIDIDGQPHKVALCKFVSMAQDVSRYAATERKLDRKSKWYSELEEKPTYIQPYTEKAADIQTDEPLYELPSSFVGHFDEYYFDVAPDATITHKIGRRWKARTAGYRPAEKTNNIKCN